MGACRNGLLPGAKQQASLGAKCCETEPKLFLILSVILSFDYFPMNKNTAQVMSKSVRQSLRFHLIVLVSPPRGYGKLRLHILLAQCRHTPISPVP